MKFDISILISFLLFPGAFSFLLVLKSWRRMRRGGGNRGSHAQQGFEPNPVTPPSLQPAKENQRPVRKFEKVGPMGGGERVILSLAQAPKATHAYTPGGWKWRRRKRWKTGMKTDALWPESPYTGYNNESIREEGREDPQVSLPRL